MINKLRNIKNKTKMKFNRTISNYFVGMNYHRQGEKLHFEENLFGENAAGAALYCMAFRI